MAERLGRRTFIATTLGLTLGVAAARTAVRAQRYWTLTVEAVPVTHGFALQISFSLDFLDGEPLFIHVADKDSSSFSFTWMRISESPGDELVECGPFDLPYGRPYVVTIVTLSGVRHP